MKPDIRMLLSRRNWRGLWGCDLLWLMMLMLLLLRRRPRLPQLLLLKALRVRIPEGLLLWHWRSHGDARPG